MKIYCILCDSVPLGNILEDYLKLKRFHHFTQVSNYFTTTSIISLLTGKLPSDLEEGGIGYHTHFNYKVNGKIEYSWKEQLLIYELYYANWNIHFHNATWFYPTICNDNFIEKSCSYPVKVEDMQKYYDTQKKDYVRELLSKDSLYYKKEKEFIRKIQTEKTKKNKFYFIKNNQYHEALVNKTNKEKALKLIEQWFGYWDFEEEDAIFYIFSDHHDFTKIDKLCKAPSMLTWACVKVNSQIPINFKRHYIHIKDFSEFDYEEAEDRDRIYFTEDARCNIDTQNSTTAVVCKFIDWVNNRPKRLVQVSYFKPENKYYGFVYDLESKKLQPYPVLNELKQALRGRFEWIK